MKKLVSTLLLAGLLMSYVPNVSALDEEKVYQSVLKIRTYEYNSSSDTYTLQSLGSAVAIGSGRLLTNAHVIFDDAQDKPTGFYEICRTIDFRKKATCFTTGELVAYDEAKDLAMLTFTEPTGLPTAPIFQEDRIRIGAPVFMYGYPGIGGENITRTEGNIAGYEEPYYKIDGAIDHGNSGGGAFNRYGELLGIPTRVASDNAVIGYMIPTRTVRDFIAGKTAEYTPVSLPVPKDFKDFIRVSQAGDRSKDIINDLNIKTLSLKKYGLKFSMKQEAAGLFSYYMKFSNLAESSVMLSCSRIGWAYNMEVLDSRSFGDTLKKYRDTRTTFGPGGRYVLRTFESLISSERDDMVRIYDTKNTCAMSLVGISVSKDKKLISQMQDFYSKGITLKASFPENKTSYQTQIFTLKNIPQGVSIYEDASSDWETSVAVGYLSTRYNSGETFSYISQKSRDTLDAYFLGSSSYYDNSPSDTSLTPSEYSYETLRKLYEKKYTGADYSNTVFTIARTKNNKPIIIWSTRYKDSSDATSVYQDAIIISYPYMVVNKWKKEYRELTYVNSYEWGSKEGIGALRQFFLDFEPIGDAPF
jgi:Trypsin-like peptidase domain